MKRKSLFRQAEEVLLSMAAYGDSKHADKEKNNGKPDPQKIYSYNGMKNYLDVAHQFTEWVKDKYRHRAVDEARQYVGEYLELRKNSKNSAWTVRRDAAALAKLFGCQTTDFGVELPVRRRRDIKQHRDDNGSDISRRTSTPIWSIWAEDRGSGGARFRGSPQRTSIGKIMAQLWYSYAKVRAARSGASRYYRTMRSRSLPWRRRQKAKA